MMDKTGTIDAGLSRQRALLAPQVAEGRYFFLQLAAARGPGATVAFGGREACRPDFRLVRETFAYHVIEFIAEGSGVVRLDGRTHAVTPGTVFAYAPTTRLEIATDPARPIVKYFLCLGGRDAAARLKRARVPVRRVLHVGAPGEVRSVWDDLIREGQWHGSLTREICAALAEILLLKIEAAVRAASSTGTEPARESFLRCKALIDANAERLVSLENIADAAGCDVSTISRLFRRYQGTSPYQYLLRRKMNLAAEHLVESGALVKEVAQRVGFTDPYHFSRAFKAVHGVSPRHLHGYRP